MCERRLPSPPAGGAPSTTRTVAALQGLDAEAFAILPVAERDLVRRYYGLAADGRPHSRRELMEQTGMARYALQRLLRHGVRLLLDPVTAGLAATCVVCGAAFTRDDVGSARVTCSPACARQRRLTTMRQGGFERISAAARERGRSARAQLRDLDARHPALFAALPERDRLIVRLYHGLPVEGLTVERPWTIREIVGYLGAGASQWKVGDTLHRGVERLLRPDEARSDAERQAAKVARMSAAARERGRAGAEGAARLAGSGLRAPARTGAPSRPSVLRAGGWAAVDAARTRRRLRSVHRVGRSGGDDERRPPLG